MTIKATEVAEGAENSLMRKGDFHAKAIENFTLFMQCDSCHARQGHQVDKSARAIKKDGDRAYS
jgi:hypothetical protein